MFFFPPATSTARGSLFHPSQGSRRRSHAQATPGRSPQSQNYLHLCSGMYGRLFPCVCHTQTLVGTRWLHYYRVFINSLRLQVIKRSWCMLPGLDQIYSRVCREAGSKKKGCKVPPANDFADRRHFAFLLEKRKKLNSAACMSFLDNICLNICRACAPPVLRRCAGGHCNLGMQHFGLYRSCSSVPHGWRSDRRCCV